MNNDIESRVNNFFANPYLTSTYKIVLFKAILDWCQDTDASDTLLLSLDTIAKYFINTYAHNYQNKELLHLTNKKKTIEFFNLLEKANLKDQKELTDNKIKFILDDAKNIILQDVIYRFRNNCHIYDFVQFIGLKFKIIKTPDKIQENNYLKFKSNIEYLKFDKEIISWLRSNRVILEKSLNYLFIEFLLKLNIDNPDIIKKISYLIDQERKD